MSKQWAKTSLLEDIEAQTKRRSLKDLTISPTLSISNDRFKEHLDAVLALEGTELLWGGKPLTGHTIPPQYGCYEPTAVKVPIKHFNNTKKAKLLLTELFAPF